MAIGGARGEEGEGRGGRRARRARGEAGEGRPLVRSCAARCVARCVVGGCVSERLCGRAREGDAEGGRRQERKAPGLRACLTSCSERSLAASGSAESMRRYARALVVSAESRPSCVLAGEAQAHAGP